MGEFACLLAVFVFLVTEAISRARMEKINARLRKLSDSIRALETKIAASRAQDERRGSEAPDNAASGVGLPVERQAESVQNIFPAIPPPLPAVTFSQGAKSSFSNKAAEFPAHPSAARTTSAPPGKRLAAPAPFSLEAFMGVKMFSWIGGLLAFLAIAFFIKYSFEHNLITPLMRVTLGTLAGLSLVATGWFVPRERYAVTGQTLCATGIVTLYGVIFSAHSLYGFFRLSAAFVLMTGITAGAFLLAVRMPAQVIAILGLLGGFLTPVLLSTRQDHPLALFSYVALLDAGLIAVALRQRWRHLMFLAAIATLLMQWDWCISFFQPAKVFSGGAIFIGFEALFVLAFWFANGGEKSDLWSTMASCLMGGSVLGFCSALLTYGELGRQPWIVLTLPLLADALLVAMQFRRPALQVIPGVSGGVVFLLLGAWNVSYLDHALLPWALAYFVAFAAFHTVAPVVLRRLQPQATVTPSRWTQMFPALGVLLMLLPASRMGSSTLLWSAVLIVDLVAIALAAYSASLLGLAAALVLTLAAAELWLTSAPATPSDLIGLLVVIAGFAALFCGASAFLQRRLQLNLAGKGTLPEHDGRRFLPALSAVLPFLLLVSVFEHLRLPDPSQVFAVGLFLALMLLFLARWSGDGRLPLAGLGCVLMIQFAWAEVAPPLAHGHPELAWNLVFTAVFAVFPFCFQPRTNPAILPWASAALSAPLHYWLITRGIEAVWPRFWELAAGTVPAALALPYYGAVEYLRRAVPRDNPARPALLAWFGGAFLFLVTLIFAAQFHHEWLTISWAIEGAALLWLWHRIPHLGLKAAGFGLLCVAFARLTLNFDVFAYHARSGVPVANWRLYTFGIPAAALFAGGALTQPPRHRLLRLNICAILYALATLICFLLLNIEIADYFATGPAWRFDFNGSIAQDMAYSIAWSLFALGMLFAGMIRRIGVVRYAGIALLSITLLKVFLHDLASLDQLYRIAATLVVAVVVTGSSFLYQRFLGKEKETQAPHSLDPP